MFAGPLLQAVLDGKGRGLRPGNPPYGEFLKAALRGIQCVPLASAASSLQRKTEPHSLLIAFGSRCQMCLVEQEVRKVLSGMGPVTDLQHNPG